MPAGFEAAAKPSSALAGITMSLAAFFGFGVSTKAAAPLPPLPAGSVAFDFDGDAKADIARFRGSNGEWLIKKSSDASTATYTLGSSSSVIVPADYDADAKTDYAVFEPSNGSWTIRRSSTNTDQTITGFGQAGDKPASGDYDGDAKADAAFFRPSNGTWYIRKSSDGTTASTQFGMLGDIAVPGNYDGDAKMDCAVFRPSSGHWFVLFSSTGGYTQFQWGASADIPVPADFDGDNKTDFAVYRGSSGTWYVYKSSTNNGSYISQAWGNYGDQPAAADYDGDQKADFAVWRPATGVWYFIKSSNSAFDYASLGANGDAPVPASYLKQIGSLPQGYDLAKARLSPKNATGGTNLYSRNFGWETALVGLSGRAGFGASLGVSYNSLVWTKQGSNIYFDADNSNISPGFRMGFPTFEPAYLDTTTGKYNYLMVSPSGARVEFRQINGASDTYETADSGYVQLKTKGAFSPNDATENISLIVTGTGGTKMNFVWKAGAFRCAQIKDRNGNYISISHDDQGLLRTVTDTLGRAVNVNYDSDLYPISITQTWKNNNGAGSDVTHTWATFSYTTATVNTGFSGLTVYGPANGTTLKVLQKITYSNGASTLFDYNSYAQVWKVSNVAADSPAHILNYVRTNLENPASNQTDSPRYTETREWTENFNLDQQGAAQEVVFTNSITENQTYNVPNASGTATLLEVSMANHPQQAVSKTYVGASGWQEGLPIVAEDWANEGQGLTRKRYSWNHWTQDDTSKTYILNPRIIENRVGDEANIKKTEAEYYPVSQGSPVALYGLVKEVRVYDANQTTVLKRATTEYNLNPSYISKRIIGLPSKSELYGAQNELLSKVTYVYDEDSFGDTSLEQNISPVQHDSTGYGANFVIGRGNLTSTIRWNVEHPTDIAYAVTSSAKYNTAGAVVLQLDALNRGLKISYADNFNDGINTRATFAYATKLTETANADTANNFSQIKYRFDTGANVWAKGPKPAGNTSGKETVREFDSIGRLLKETIVNNGAYVRYEYPSSLIQSKSYATVSDNDNDGADYDDEVFSERWVDGAGRVLKSRTENPGSAGGFTGALTEYTILGQIKRSSVPTEINSNWTPAGDDAARGWLWTSQIYDWKGRIKRIIPSDSNGADGKDQLFSYEGCGCSGREIITVQSEEVPVPGQGYNARRTQKIHSDILGRQYKVETLNWNATSVYSTILHTFNGRDQIVKTRHYAGTTESLTYQDLTMTYDGHSRLKSRHFPIEGDQTETSWIYNADDSVQQVIDPRGSITSFAYNARGLVEQISYAPPANYPPPNSPAYRQIPDSPTVSFLYDSLGNRIKMTEDGFGEVEYEYNQLSQVVAETRKFSDSLPDAPLSGNRFKIEYQYNFSGLKSIKDPFGSQLNYTYDKIGRLTQVGGTSYGTGGNSVSAYADAIQYRAFGAVKQMTYRTDDNSQVSMQYDNRLRVSQHQVATNAVDGGYLKKATFSYFNDSRPQFMDNEVNPEFDRSYQYDHIGRLSGNQFGGQHPVPYAQTIQYDAFSQITSRVVNHWYNNSSYASTFDKGRETTTGVYGTEYDASGNQIHTGSRGDNLYHTTQFDAANRKKSFSSRRRVPNGRFSYNVVTDSFTQFYDGDGQPLKMARDVEGQAQPTQTKYQIWSSVIGNYLTEVDYTGKKEKTKVFAGGAVIAEQVRVAGANNTTIDAVEWLHADPVSGSSTRVNKDGTVYFRREYEPLGGQEVYPSEPEDEFPEPLNHAAQLFNADGVLWQCMFLDETDGAFTVPTRCGLAAMENLDLSLVPSLKDEGNADKISEVNGIAFSGSSAISSSDKILNWALKATAKQDDKNKKKKKVKRQKPVLVDVPKGTPRRPVIEDEIEKPIVPSEPPEFDLNDSFETNFKKWGDFLWFLTRIEIIGFTAEQESIISRQISMLFMKPCADAMRAANLPTFGQRLKQYPLVIANSNTLGNSNKPYNDRVVPGIGSDLRSLAKGMLEQPGVFAFSTTEPYNNRNYIFLDDDAFNSKTAGQSFNVVFAHETIHTSGQPGKYTYEYGKTVYDLFGVGRSETDLNYMPGYSAIIENCSTFKR